MEIFEFSFAGLGNNPRIYKICSPKNSVSVSLELQPGHLLIELLMMSMTFTLSRWNMNPIYDPFIF